MTTTPSAGFEELRKILKHLTGYPPPFEIPGYDDALELLQEGNPGIGWSQFNELLLLLGYKRVSVAFFQFLVDKTTNYKQESTIKSMEALKRGVDNFRQIALINYGSITHAYDELSTEEEILEAQLENLERIDPVEYEQRQAPLCEIHEISGQDTYYLGYISAEKLNPEQIIRQSEVRRLGKRNYDLYLSSDYLDVYIATSMREKHEYFTVNEVINNIFHHHDLKDLKLRWFDPTQAYCPNRIDKGLFEALMLKRAKCTIYLIQESDTFGKDSELASTLAQGKPVIAYVPLVDDGFTEDLIKELSNLNPTQSERDLILEQLRRFEPSQAWNNQEIRNWIDAPSSFNIQAAKDMLHSFIKRHYDKRAEVLAATHPLGLQVNLQTGVANGVLVVRTVDKCAALIRRILTNSMEFSISVDVDKTGEYLYLRERISDCIYRVVSGDPLLTNTFWNFYLDPA